jgi:NAD(P)-dependent dehydrogenase (short-subunit alcohol dehydrogenase family)
MHLPGRSCLLRNMSLRFIAPIFPPVRLLVSGHRIGAETHGVGRVEAIVQDAFSGHRYVEAGYEYGHSGVEKHDRAEPPDRAAPHNGDAPIIVTGASGGLGRAVLNRLATRGLGVSRTGGPGTIVAADGQELERVLGDRTVAGIVHCGWPPPDNERLIAISDVGRSVEHHVGAPVRDIVSLAQMLAKHGTPDAMLIVIGSTFSEPGRHGYRMPLYSLAKSMIPTLVRALALELAPSGRRCAAITFDVIEGGMNKTLSAASRAAHADRSPFGKLTDLDDAASQILWLLDNKSCLTSGATLALTGGALP